MKRKNETAKGQQGHITDLEDAAPAFGLRLVNMVYGLNNAKLVALIGGLLVLAITVLAFFFSAVHGAGDRFASALDDASDRVRNEFYEIGYDQGEKDNHTSNRGRISVEKLREEALLEVLEVTDSEYVIEEKSANDRDIQVWLEVPTRGVFTVDLRKAEFLVDEAHAQVSIRLPLPELTNFTILHEDVNTMLFQNNILNDSFAVGTELAQKMEQEGYSMGRQECLANPYYMDSAKHAAINMLALLTKQLNPDYPELQVEIEFL